MKRQLLKFSLLLFVASALMLSSCKKDNEKEENEPEIITTMQLTFVPVGTGNTLTYKFDDPDGPGGSSPTIDQIVLEPHKIYNATLQLFNKTANLQEDITAEVQDEKESHRVYYEVVGVNVVGVNLTIATTDVDENGVPVGVTSTWTTGSASTGKAYVTLRHYAGTPPNKATGDPVDSRKSSTDITTKDVGGFSVRVY